MQKEFINENGEVKNLLPSLPEHDDAEGMDSEPVIPHQADDPPCGPVNRNVNFCCEVEIPEGFMGVIDDIRLIYNTNQLRAHIEECDKTVDTDCGPVTVPLYQVRVTGCIPFIGSVSVIGDCGGLETTGNDPACPPALDNSGLGRISCSGKVCVDHVIGCSTTLPTTLPALNCDTIPVTGYGVFNNNRPGVVCGLQIICRSIIFAGTFQLPAINDSK
ncbi:hypothetical protein [Mesobacillus jeotgali]|uniref:hypothetical protein n=1 Tax=Mesobacillus jeotgali TaxID=129985 RepID=UPI0009A611DF|nr:hypothetical protein [Mesobacillus jeotgali]